MASQIGVKSVVCSATCSVEEQRKYQSSTSLTFARGIYRLSMDSSHKGPVKQKGFPHNHEYIDGGCSTPRNIRHLCIHDCVETLSVCRTFDWCTITAAVGLLHVIMTWNHFWRYSPFMRKIHQRQVVSTRKGPVTRALIFSLMHAWTHDWTYSRDAMTLMWRHCNAMLMFQWHLPVCLV